jgi:hypothetical protein
MVPPSSRLVRQLWWMPELLRLRAAILRLPEQRLWLRTEQQLRLRTEQWLRLPEQRLRLRIGLQHLRFKQ